MSTNDEYTAANAETPTPNVAYGESASIAWDSAFKAQEETQAPAPEPVLELGNDQPELSELNFDEMPSTASALDADGSGAHHSYIINDTEPLAEGATFASAFTSTGEATPAAEGLAATAIATDIEPAEPQTPVRESVLPAAALATATTNSDWGADPGAPSLADIPEEPKKRIGAHIGSIFATLLLVPITWYLLSDAGIRMSLVEGNPWASAPHSPQIFVLLEFLGGLIAMYVLWLMARASTLGAQIWGVVLTVAGMAAVVVPALGVKVSQEIHDELWGINSFTQNVAHHLDLDLASGRIAIFGFALLLTGIMIHLGRKSSQKRAIAMTVREQVLGSK